MRQALIHPNQADVKTRIEQFAGQKVYGQIELVEDTTQIMNIYRGQVMRLDMNEYYVLGDVHEPRFGMQDTPKFWVKKAIDLDSGETKIIKLVFHEEFVAHIGALHIRCFRSPEKEARVLDLTRDDDRFMHGYSVLDPKRNVVRVIDFIYGKTLYEWIMDLEMPHEEYFHTLFPIILRELCTCMKAIQVLHEHGLCHGDIRNDHIIIEQGTKLFRWIDFDLTQDYSDYDVWSFSNILWFCAGMGMTTFHEVANSSAFPDSAKLRLSEDDASAFYRYRILNLKKLYGYIPEALNAILMRFATNSTHFYDRMDQMVADVEEAMAKHFPLPGPAGRQALG
ncbi:MAG: hypothetical protein C4523_13680 [Myxococcales bacterium]|nr:MAG: hypothetical protein C4523_13680 [Myxococcales bacterium]